MNVDYLLRMRRALRRLARAKIVAEHPPRGRGRPRRAGRQSDGHRRGRDHPVQGARRPGADGPADAAVPQPHQADLRRLTHAHGLVRLD